MNDLLKNPERKWGEYRELTFFLNIEKYPAGFKPGN
jgi:hypothetical protein